MKKFLVFLLGTLAIYYFFQNDILRILDQLKNNVNSTNVLAIENKLQSLLIPAQNAPKQAKNPAADVQIPAESIPTLANTKYPPTQIQTYQVGVNNGKIIVAGKETPYGQYINNTGVILYIEEPRANKKVTVKVPFTDGKIFYEYPLTYTVGDVIVNLDEYKNGVQNDPNKVMGYAEYHLTDGDPYLLSSFMVQSNNPEIVALAQNITKGKTTAVDKSHAIFEWVAKNISYNAPLINDPNPPLYSALQTYESRDVLCTGYADLSAALHRAVGIEAKVVYGDNHAWNEVYLNGVWQIEDPTYGSGFINANTGAFVHSYQPAYFYKSDSHEQGIYPF